MISKNIKSILGVNVFKCLFALLVVSPLLVVAQSDKVTKRLIRKADNNYLFSDFNRALPLYLELLKAEPNNFLYNYRAGMCYMNSNIETSKCLNYLETAHNNLKIPNDSTAEFYYFLGHAYQIKSRFDNAIKYLTVSKSMLDGHKDSVNIYFINIEIEQCKNGKKAVESPSMARIFNMGDKINTIYPDYSPVASPDQKVLFFTSTRKESTSGKKNELGEYFEDIFLTSNTWSPSDATPDIETSFYAPDILRANFLPAVNAGTEINTRWHEASISMTADGKKLNLFKNNAVWQSDVVNNTSLGAPVKFDYLVDGKPRTESSITVSPDGKTLYFVSKQKDGIGGKDIYKSNKLDNGTWGPAENLGPMINTELDEESPYIDPNEDGVLYFSSQGHNSIGGFDVFKSRFDNNVWSKPRNLGYPINSGTDDVFYSFDLKNNRGFISTMRDDAIGNYDIYMLRYAKPLDVMFASTFSNGLKPVSANALIEKASGNMTLALGQSAKVNYQPNEKVKISIPYYDSTQYFNVFEFETPESFGDFGYYQEINYDEVKNHKNQLIGYKTTLYNAFFDIDKEMQKAKYPKSNLTGEAAYSAFVKPLKSENQYFQVLSKVNYIDTSIYAIQEEELASRKLAEEVTALAVVTDKATIKPTNPTKKEIAVKTEEKTKLVASSKTAPVSVPTSETVFKTILFNFSGIRLDADAKAEVQQVADYLKANPDVKMEIVGYTDAKGGNRYNNELSKKRAVEVKLTLMQMGVDKKRLKAKGMGEKNPVSANKNDDKSDNKEGRKLNRRVEFIIMK